MASKIGSGAAYGGSALPSIAGVGSDVTNDINVVPMIDIMLVLLIIFMVIIPSVAYQAVLPTSVTSAQESDDRVELGIDTNGYFFLDDITGAVPAEALAGQLQRLYSTRPEDHVLYLKADVGVPYSVVLTAIDAARVAGVRRIGAITTLDPLAQPAEGS